MKPVEARTVECHATSGSALRIVTCCRFVPQGYINSCVTKLPVFINTDFVLLVLKVRCSADDPDMYSDNIVLESDCCARGVRTFLQLLYTIKGKGKAIPLQAWIGPEGSRRLRFPEFKTIGA